MNSEMRYASLFAMRAQIERIVNNTVASDLHTHLYTPHFGPAIHLWGVDELVTYHYLVAEQFRFCSLTPAQFWAMSKEQQADHIWQTLFVERAPLSEASARGYRSRRDESVRPAARLLR